MRPLRWVPGAAIALLASVAAAQQSAPEVQTVIVSPWPPATPEIRSIAVIRNLDRNHDQFLTEDEVEPPLSRAQQSLENRRRKPLENHRQGSWINDGPVPRRSSAFKRRRVADLTATHGEFLASGYELSLVDEEFHRLFADLPGEQRSALLEADVNGNNDGMVTVREFYSHTRRVLRRKTQFEADFGEEAYLRVLRLFGVIR